MLCHSANGCFEHAVLLTVRTTGGPGMRRMRSVHLFGGLHPPLNEEWHPRGICPVIRQSQDRPGFNLVLRELRIQLRTL